MGISWVCRAVLLYLVPFLNLFHISVIAMPGSFLTVKSSTSWTNSLSAPHSVKFDDGSFVTIILTHGSPDPYGYACGCGFLYNRTYNSSLFVIFSLYYEDGNTTGSYHPETVWSANPKNPVSLDATLQLTSEGGLVLEDANGTKAWSTNISNKSVVGLNLTEDTCNLMLLDDKNATIWQSFDHPTDTLVLGQKLLRGQQLTSEGGMFSFSITSEGLFFYINSNPPDIYLNLLFSSNFKYNYSQFWNHSFAIFELDDPLPHIPFKFEPNSKYMKLRPDGHLKVYDEYWIEALDFLKRRIGFCGYPTVCGNYSICTNEQCSCPLPINGTNHFQPINDRQPNHGCSLVTPLSCESYKNHILTELENITYFPFQKYLPDIHPDHRDISLESCKESCLKVCSCKAAIYNTSNRVGNCYLRSQIFSMMYADERDIREDTYFKVFIKVQNVPLPPLPPQQQKHWIGIILGSSLAFVLFLLIGFFVFLFWKKETANEAEENYLNHVPGMPTRYSYDDLQVITNNFSKELGGGGFGTVFEGTQIDNTKVAVKRLDGFNQINKSFLAEVETIGSIHHFNLVRLIGFCAEKSHRLLVYDYMSNGSLDKWVFHKNPKMLLDWQHRKKIILDTARGLTYLHEECRLKIVHLDIKPHNILLDENCNAKVSDFGLSKLVDRDQSQVVTTMRGTPGYMAPEWLNSIITEKVDVYSFGVVLLELLCGRRNLDRSRPEEEMHLLDLFRKKIEEERLLDLVDKNSGDMQLHGKDVVNMMMVAAWCLQIDFTKRPSMSTVVKVLEGVVDVESNLDYCFSNPPLPNTRARVDNQDGHIVATTLVLPSVLSGPR
ncbi:G-type lectin S-receptor-like serine/threonine-protein kinase SD2-5 [Quercus suber]|uniref:G-type lectin S-receptor-like serine/threonine-protein kinase SD2-5 n=1 Tax=Quercus suber TaxID=58331 RepID=UPI000CE23D55|nr:G-type lectin S-receptor-like serine/threonine-protein kinase SD2-5 [Quercus suber]